MDQVAATETNKMIITVINLIIVGMLPFWAWFHIRYLKRLEYKSEEWWVQIIIVMYYVSAFFSEVPAFWARFKAYYQYHLAIPDGLYILTTWDRLNHLLTYVLVMFLTWSVTYKRVPSVFKDTLS